VIVSLLPTIAAVFMLLFARFGTMVMLLPGLGEQAVPARIRLAMALVLCFLFYPMVSGLYPADRLQVMSSVILLMAGEMAIGFMIGLATRIMMSVLQTAGTTIASQTGLAFAMSMDPGQGTQGALFGNFLSLLGITLIFVTDLHYMAIAALYDSFTLFPPGKLLPVGDAAEFGVGAVADAFRVAMQIAAPFIVFGLVFYLGLGLLNRLMPQMQIFFIAMPATIMFGLLLTFLLLGSMMAWYLNHIEIGLGRFLAQ